MAAAFSSIEQQQQQHHHHHPFHPDSVFLPNSPSTIHNNNMCGLLLHEPNIKINNRNGSITNSNLDHHFTNNIHNEASASASLLSVITNKNSMDYSSSVVTQDHDKFDSSEQQVSQKLITTTPALTDKKRRCKEASSPNSAQSKDKREVKGGKKQKKMKDGEAEKEKPKEEEKSAAKEAPKGYIHVRARRGQATDSHSLAERVRRERISERMKLLQALVPGCDKVTGKALMLDEIINYVQSLQTQVEFLSMKLASVNPMFYDFGMDLESFMVRPDQDLSNLPSPLPGMQEGSPTAASEYHLLENSANSILFQQTQIPNIVPPQLQGSRQTLWEVDDHRQKIINQSGFSNSLFSLH